MAFLDSNGLKSLLTGLSDKINAKLAGKVSTVVSADDTQLHVDATDAANPKLSLGADIVTKIGTLWTLTNNGTGETAITDAQIEQLLKDTMG